MGKRQTKNNKQKHKRMKGGGMFDSLSSFLKSSTPESGATPSTASSSMWPSWLSFTSNKPAADPADPVADPTGEGQGESQVAQAEPDAETPVDDPNGDSTVDDQNNGSGQGGRRRRRSKKQKPLPKKHRKSRKH